MCLRGPDRRRKAKNSSDEESRPSTDNMALQRIGDEKSRDGRRPPHDGIDDAEYPTVMIRGIIFVNIQPKRVWPTQIPIRDLLPSLR